VSVAAEGKVDVSVIPPQCHCGGRFSVEGRLGRLAVCRCQGCGKVVTVEPLRRFDPRSGDVLDLHAEAQRDAVRGLRRTWGDRLFLACFWLWLCVLSLAAAALAWQLTGDVLQALRG
jgi:hypothetical protein